VGVLWQASQGKGEYEGQKPEVGGEYGLGRSTQTLILFYCVVNFIIWID
jgi:hypothetical protein